MASDFSNKYGQPTFGHQTRPFVDGGSEDDNIVPPKTQQDEDPIEVEFNRNLFNNIRDDTEEGKSEANDYVADNIFTLAAGRPNFNQVEQVMVRSHEGAPLNSVTINLFGTSQGIIEPESESSCLNQRANTLMRLKHLQEQQSQQQKQGIITSQTHFFQNKPNALTSEDQELQQKTHSEVLLYQQKGRAPTQHIVRIEHIMGHVNEGREIGAGGYQPGSYHNNQARQQQSTNKLNSNSNRQSQNESSPQNSFNQQPLVLRTPIKQTQTQHVVAQQPNSGRSSHVAHTGAQNFQHMMTMQQKKLFGGGAAMNQGGESPNTNGRISPVKRDMRRKSLHPPNFAHMNTLQVYGVPKLQSNRSKDQESDSIFSKDKSRLDDNYSNNDINPPLEQYVQRGSRNMSGLHNGNYLSIKQSIVQEQIQQVYSGARDKSSYFMLVGSAAGPHSHMQSGAIELSKTNSIMLMSRYKDWVKQEESYINQISGFHTVDRQQPASFKAAITPPPEESVPEEEEKIDPMHIEYVKKNTRQQEIENMLRKNVNTFIKQTKKQVSLWKKLRCRYTKKMKKRCLRFRVRCDRINSNRLFQWFMLLSVFFNSMILGFYDYQDGKEFTDLNMAIDWGNKAFTLLYVIEIIIEIGATGFLEPVKKNGEPAYMRSVWHYIDVTIIITGLTEIFLGQYNINHKIRSLRCLRPLKMTHMIVSLRKLIESLVFALPDFANVGIFVIFVFLLFSTMGLHLYNGYQYNQCRTTPQPVGNSWPYDHKIQRMCSTSGFGHYHCPGDLVCGNPAGYDQVDLETENLQYYAQYGIINFDNVGTSLLTVFQMITSETWQFQMYNIMDADVPLLGVIYAFLVIIVGQFFLLNLILAVIIEAFISIQKRELKAKMERLQSQHSTKKNPNDPAGKLIDQIAGEESSLETESSSSDESIFYVMNEKENMTRKQSIARKKKRDVKGKQKSEKKDNSEDSSRGSKDDDKLVNDEDLFLKETNKNQKKADRVKKKQKNQEMRNAISQFIKNGSEEDEDINEEGDEERGNGPLHKGPRVGKEKRNSMHRGKPNLKRRGTVVQQKEFVEIDDQFDNEKSQELEVNASPGALNFRNQPSIKRKRTQNEDNIHTFLKSSVQKRKVMGLLMSKTNTQREAQLDGPEGGGLGKHASVSPETFGRNNSQMMLSDKGFDDDGNQQTDRFTTNFKSQPFGEDQPAESNSVSQGLGISNNNNTMLNIPVGFKIMVQQVPPDSGLNVDGGTQDILAIPKFGESTSIPINRRPMLKVEVEELDQPDESMNNSNLKMFNRQGTAMSSQYPEDLGDFKQIAEEEKRKKQEEEENKKIDPDVSNPYNQIMTQLEAFMQSNIDEKFQKQLAEVVKLAKQNFDQFKNDPKMKGQSLRQLVGLKFCMEMIKKVHMRATMSENQLLLEERLKEKAIYRIAFKLTVTQAFKLIMVILVSMDVIVQALDRYPIHLDNLYLQEYFNVFYLFIYSLELAIRITAMGFKCYFKGSKFNFLDIFIVGFGMVDLVLATTLIWGNESSLMNGTLITVIRTFRLFRTFKLARYWLRFELLLETMGKTVMDMGAFSIFLFLFVYIYTILGLEFFEHKAKINDQDKVDLVHGVSPVFHFDDFLNSFFTVFIIVTNDGQSLIYYNYYRAVSGPLSTAYWVTLVILGQKVLLNLFLAFLLENFDEGSLKSKIMDLQVNVKKDATLIGAAVKNKLAKSPSMVAKLSDKIKIIAYNKWFILKEAIRMLDPFEREIKQIAEFQHKVSTKGSIVKEPSSPHKQSTGKGFTAAISLSAAQAKKKEDYNPDIPFLYGHSLGIFSCSNPLRIFLFNMVKGKIFEYFIIVIIILSSVQLALDGPLVDPKSELRVVLDIIDIVTTTVFAFEAGAKILSLGFLLNGPWSYIRKPYNQLDFLIIVMSILSLTSLSDDLSSIKMLRIFRALRLVSKNDGLKVAISALFQAIPNVANVTIIMLLFFLIFGLISTSFFKGKLYYCVGKTILPFQTKWECINVGGDWVNRCYTFDNAVEGLVTLFSMSTGDGWAQVVVDTLAASDIDMHPTFGRSAIWIIFYIVFMMFGFAFFLNLFVGVVVSNFNSEADKIGGNNLLTEKQKEWIDLKLLVLRSQPIQKLKPPPNKLRRFFFKINEQKHFHNGILICIVLNTFTLMMKWYDQPPQVYQTTEALNYIFTTVFFLEVIIKNCAVGPRLYFNDNWNTFDFAIVCGSFAGIFISSATNIQIKGATSVFRAFRIMRIMRLIKRGSNSLNLIFNTFVITLHSLVNIGGLLLVFIYMYSILGMLIFGNMKRSGIMNDYINFENFTNSFITLFTVATADTWQYTMSSFASTRNTQYQCEYGAGYEEYVKNGYITMGCGGKLQAYIYFVSYMFVVNLVFLKLFIAIILQGYSSTQTQDKRLFNIDMNERFREVWAEFDPEATTFINMSQLRHFLFALGEPLGFDSRYLGQRFQQDQFIANLDLPTYQNFSSYQFMDILDALSFRLMVLDHIKKQGAHQGEVGGEKGNEEKTLQEENDKMVQANVDMEALIKDQMQKEINKLIFQKRSENIAAVKEVWEKELKKIRHKEKNKDKAGFTSSHHMAAEVAIRQMRHFIKVSRKLRTKIEFTQKEMLSKNKNRTINDFKQLGSNLYYDDEMSLDSDFNEVSRQSSILKQHRGQSILGQIGTPSNLNMMPSNLFNRPSGITGLQSSISLQRLPQNQQSKISMAEEQISHFAAPNKKQPSKIGTNSNAGKSLQESVLNSNAPMSIQDNTVVSKQESSVRPGFHTSNTRGGLSQFGKFKKQTIGSLNRQGKNSGQHEAVEDLGVIQGYNSQESSFDSQNLPGTQRTPSKILGKQGSSSNALKEDSSSRFNVKRAQTTTAVNPKDQPFQGIHQLDVKGQQQYGIKEEEKESDGFGDSNSANPRLLQEQALQASGNEDQGYSAQLNDNSSERLGQQIQSSKIGSQGDHGGLDNRRGYNEEQALEQMEVEQEFGFARQNLIKEGGKREVEYQMTEEEEEDYYGEDDPSNDSSRKRLV
ncbi:hypothetical protein FGO68_gene12429 [Halteria grandinella]|uniref:Uncharacterized protein n=1 Tax=Halteria grandinella TaxID=5974 RepID=A0A8J8P9D1_HALGN|nr:hypothetical protein FGO68_gene12429 [Halteria grandinella]